MIPTDFHFERPLLLLALLPAAFVLWHCVRAATRGTAWRDAVDAHLLRHLTLPGEGGTRTWPFWMLGAGWLAASLAMAGPSWERVAQPTTKTTEATVVALDMSVSMDAEDLTPSRLARARYKLQDVLERSAGGQVGLVIYSDEPFVASPLTDDGRVIAEMIPTLTSDIMPGRGSRPDRAIDQAAALLEQAGVPGGRILVFGDSAGDDPSATRAAAARAAESGRRVSVLAIGTQEGAPVPDGRGGFARTADGERFLASVPVDELRALAASGGGRFANLTSGETDLDVLLAERLSLASTSDDASVSAANVEIWKDAGVYLLFLPILLAPLAFRRGWLAVVLIGIALSAPSEARAGVWDDLWQTPDQQGAEALAAGDAESASDLFEASDWRAAAQYESGEYEEASTQFAALFGEENRYNLGNALARTGKLEEAISAYDEVLEAEPGHEDATFNRDLVEKLLDQQQQEQQQQQSQNGEGSEDPEQQPEDGEGQEQEQSEADGGGEEQPQENASQSGGEGAEQKESVSEQASSESEGEPSTEQRETASGEGEESEREPSAQAKSGSEQEDPSSEQQAQRPEVEEGDGSNSVSDRLDEALENAEAEGPGEPGSQMAATEAAEPISEEEQAREQMLRQVPDDPSGLLRAKIHRKYAEKRFAEQQRRLVQQRGGNSWW
ncbi:MAG: VWA domain-containing protein [Candidatus Binatia bacterium]|nr:VWA domain-containing protein [Candidatus Binatia bacterium]